MKLICFTCAIFLMSTAFGCIKAQNKSVDQPINGNKILIVYLSRTNNTKAVAEIIKDQIGGNLVALELEKPYPADYEAIVAQVAAENERAYLPPIKTKIAEIEEYDVVFVGFPTWGMQLPPPIKSFLKAHKLKGKTVIPFNTNAGYGVGSSFETLKSICKESKVLEGFSVEGGKEKDGVLFVMEGKKESQVKLLIKNWLSKIGML